jgi:DNA uptake protein ComE-like DNA-binding protein
MMVTTTVAGDSTVERESLTLRESDLHTIARSIDLRDSGTVEIAELDYGNLPWGPRTEGLFEPPSTSSLGLPGGAYSAPALHLPRLLSEAEFDEGELEARLVLHQLGADTSERIDIVRGANSVQVKGIVATQGRKREIEARLHTVPNVVSAIYTFDELQNRSGAATETTSLKLSSVVETQSPLEVYLAAKGASREVIRDAGLKLSNASVAVNRESKAIADLRDRFAGQASLTENARVALEALLADHTAKLVAALQEEERLLAVAGFPSSSTAVVLHAVNLAAAAHRNNSLCVELLSGSSEPSRPANLIVPELEAIIVELRVAAIRTPNSVYAPQASSISPSAAPHER